jgi:hypothetical protein
MKQKPTIAKIAVILLCLIYCKTQCPLYIKVGARADLESVEKDIYLCQMTKETFTFAVEYADIKYLYHNPCSLHHTLFKESKNTGTAYYSVKQGILPACLETLTDYPHSAKSTAETRFYRIKMENVLKPEDTNLDDGQMITVNFKDDGKLVNPTLASAVATKTLFLTVKEKIHFPLLRDYFKQIEPKQRVPLQGLYQLECEFIYIRLSLSKYSRNSNFVSTDAEGKLVVSQKELTDFIIENYEVNFKNKDFIIQLLLLIPYEKFENALTLIATRIAEYSAEERNAIKSECNNESHLLYDNIFGKIIIQEPQEKTILDKVSNIVRSYSFTPERKKTLERKPTSEKPTSAEQKPIQRGNSVQPKNRPPRRTPTFLTLTSVTETTRETDQGSITNRTVRPTNPNRLNRKTAGLRRKLTEQTLNVNNKPQSLDIENQNQNSEIHHFAADLLVNRK